MSFVEKKLTTVESVDRSLIKCEVKGSAEIAIVFIHCWCGNRTFWDSQVDYFSRKYQAVSLDLAGNGESISKRTNYTMLSFGQDVACVIKQMNLKKVILVGHSMGGIVAIETAKLVDDLILGIVGVDIFYTSFKYPKTDSEIVAFIKPFEEDFSKSITKLTHSMFSANNVNSTIRNSILDTIVKTDPQMAISAMYENLLWKREKENKDLQQFSKKIRNINAASTGEENSRHKNTILIPNVGHFIPQVLPQLFN
ncbi:MAG: alpha/beta fold hydrolase, partial [Prochloraceae cyanobacterium]|nr:alpha/beta fold hydrolase [Prochloraceae cyanobacterium]